ncbi:ABC transporter permease [Enterococcus haemoperoxidus ATCC BAA-382]|uniref:ABC transporter permease n=1 Tax=Enterococcus haemoperoxidus ATCC BAA-382 TaxID=1158608 RepID=R2SIT8_9ENTE|nr:methionine ABC transporter permease [Enterococcus haemoperoxidus]EOH92786.1 ABC transporter permease [Enterococcus haemoperoxidus ATCC BAA-382]EOT61529.1 ABC transporter permease [Enterococcus haemoperoxidus ATCC BAA-382]OJG55362.1 ABC transporter permease [Enterococcus haemoperoxidus]
MKDVLQNYFPNVLLLKQEFIDSTIETLYMVFWTAIIAGILGTLLGVVLVATGPEGILKNNVLYNILEKIINICRSIPFIIMLALIQPITRFLTGTTIGTTAALVPLVIGVIPFFARQIENALLEVDPGVIEAAESMGTSPLGIIFRVYLIEGLPSIIRVSSVTIINLIGLTAMAGAIGAGGLGNLAITRGYNRFQTDVTVVATLIILVLVFASQFISNTLIKKTSH